MPRRLADRKSEHESRDPEERILEEIDKVLGNISEKINTDGIKVGELVKLLQLRKELSTSQVRYTGIRWVGECDEQPASND